MELRKGQIWSVYNGKNKRRYEQGIFLIISATPLNVENKCCICARIIKASETIPHIDLTAALNNADSHLDQDSLVVCSQICTLPYEWFIDYIGALDASAMKPVESLLAEIMSLT